MQKSVNKETKIYKNEYLNISFEYPMDWEEPNTNINGENANINLENKFSIIYINEPSAGRGATLSDTASLLTAKNLDAFCDDKNKPLASYYENCEYITNKSGVKFIKAYGKWEIYDAVLEQTFYITVSPSMNYQGLFISDYEKNPKEIEELVMNINFIDNIEATAEKTKRIFDPNTGNRIYSLPEFPFDLQFPASWLLLEKENTYEVAMENDYGAVITFEKNPSSKELHELVDGGSVFDNKDSNLTTFCDDNNLIRNCVISSNEFIKELYIFSINLIPTTETDEEWIELVKYNISLK